ncbi:MAG: SCO family protein [Mariprofundaceae bacterium]
MKIGFIFSALLLFTAASVFHPVPEAVAGDSHDHASHDHANHDRQIHDHANHASRTAQRDGFTSEAQNIHIPNVVLTNQSNRKVPLKSLLESEGKLVVNFIYATCTTACPMLAAGFADLQQKFGPDIRLISISIDPENDTPKVMREHLTHYQAQPGWDFLTGSRADINTVMKAFNAFFPNKMSHTQLNFIKTMEDNEWIRIAGMPSGGDLLGEVNKAGR